VGKRNFAADTTGGAWEGALSGRQERYDQVNGGRSGQVCASIVIACYNEAELLEDSVDRLLRALRDVTWTYELVFVDDASRDATSLVIDRIVARHQDVRMVALRHDTNQGRGRTVADGLRVASGDIAGYIDIDLEIDARYIPSFVQAITDGADMAIARRYYRIRPRTIHRFILSRGYVQLVRWLLDVDVMDTEAGCKFWSTACLKGLLESTQDPGWFWDTEIVVRAVLAGHRVVEVPVVFIRRVDKRSSVRLVRDTWLYGIRLWQFRSTVRSVRAGSAVNVSA
jgi:dolichol-phosphate mannosyltransferase